MATPNNININIDFESFRRMATQIVTRFAHLSGNEVLLVLCAVFIPPLAAFLMVGFTTQFFINVLLTILGVVPGQIHALWLVLFMV